MDGEEGVEGIEEQEEEEEEKNKNDCGEGKVEDEVFSSDPPEQLPQGRRSAAQEMKSCGNATSSVESQEGKT